MVHTLVCYHHDWTKCDFQQRLHYLVFIKPHRKPGLHVRIEDIALRKVGGGNASSFSSSTLSTSVSSVLPAPVHVGRGGRWEDEPGNVIPRVIYQAYHSIDIIPAKIAGNFRQYAGNYTRYLFDDAQCLAFLRQHFNEAVVRTYNDLEGPHRADLFRYAILYVHGGIYVDIKTELWAPLETVFSVPPSESTGSAVGRSASAATATTTATTSSNRLVTFTAISQALLEGVNKGTCFQGIIATPKHNPIFLELIQSLVSTTKPIINYLISTAHMYELIGRETGQKSLPIGLSRSVNATAQFDYYLFQERRLDVAQCYDGPDRYGMCFFVFNTAGEKVLKTRYADYPWDAKRQSWWDWFFHVHN